MKIGGTFMKIEELTNIAELIAKDISNQITEEEKSELDKWKNLSKRNAALYKKLYKWENYKKHNVLYSEIDVDKGWDAVAQKTDKNTVRIMARVYMKYAAAAVVFIVMTLGSYSYLKKISAKKNSTAEVTSIVPGTNSARIILADGKIVDLDKVNISGLSEK
ncbi:MAG: hypothetical protein GXO47_10955, partial [Chlorobi bacterium]|nr:hypothetical protein [Chlorobiota bacterium]